jgi:ribonuclease P protein component
MMKKNQRVRLVKDFEKVFKKGRSAFDKIVGLKTVANDSLDNRFGVVVSNKISKKAVIRNRLKRQIRAIVEAENKKLKTGNDAIVLSQKGIENKNFQEIKEAIVRLFKKNNLYK